MNKILLTDEEAAEAFGVSERTFDALRKESWMPIPIELGPRMRRWSIDELRASVANMPRQTGLRQQPASLRKAIEEHERAMATGLKPSYPGVPRPLDVGDSDDEVA